MTAPPTRLLLDAGYFPKAVAVRPEYPHTPPVSEVLSVSHHISFAPDGWIDAWRHNQLGFFNCIADAWAAVRPADQPRHRLFAYRITAEIFQRGAALPRALPADVRPEAIPARFMPRGFDVVSRSQDDVLGFECSPLSCNGLAAQLETTAGCLFPSLDAAVAGAIRFSREQPEPGDYYLLEVLEDPVARR